MSTRRRARVHSHSRARARSRLVDARFTSRCLLARRTRARARFGSQTEQASNRARNISKRRLLSAT